MSEYPVQGGPVTMGTGIELIDPHWLTVLTRDDGAVVVRRSIRLTDGDMDDWYPEVGAFIGAHGYSLSSSDAVPSSEMFGGKAVVQVYEPVKAAA